MEARLPRGTSAGRRRGPHPPVRPPGPVASRDQPARAVVNSRCEGCARAPILRAELMSDRNWYRDCGNISNKSMDGGSSSWVCAFMTAASARRESPFPAAHGTRPSKRSTQSCLTTLTSRNSRPPMPARLPLSPCRPVPFARADSWSSRAVPPRCVSGEMAPSRDADHQPKPVVSPRAGGRSSHSREVGAGTPEHTTPSCLQGTGTAGTEAIFASRLLPSTVSVARAAPSSAGFLWCSLPRSVRGKTLARRAIRAARGRRAPRCARREFSVSPPKARRARATADPSLTRPALALTLALPSLLPRR